MQIEYNQQCDQPYTNPPDSMYSNKVMIVKHFTSQSSVNPYCHIPQAKKLTSNISRAAFKQA